MKTKAVSEQKFSSLLTKEENETVVNMLGSRCQVTYVYTAILYKF